MLTSPPHRPQSASGTTSLTGSLYSFVSRFLWSSYRVFVLSLQEDYPLWLGSFWLLWNKHQMLSSPQVSSSHRPTAPTVDMLALGSILLLKKVKDYHISWGKETDSSIRLPADVAANDSTDISAIQELRRILTKTSTTSGADAAQIPRPQSPLTMPLLSKETPPFLSKEKQLQKQNYVELLVHNVSHTDLVLSLDAPPLNSQMGGEEVLYCLCRPRFSAFDGYSRRIVDYIDEEYCVSEVSPNVSAGSTIPQENLIRFPRYERSDDNTKNYQINPEPSKVLDKIPVGFDLTSRRNRTSEHLQISSAEMNDLRVRGRDAPRVTSAVEKQSSLRLNAVFFPLLAALVPLWQTKMKEKYSFLHAPPSLQPPQEQHGNLKQVLILVSGVATPRNWTHSADGNSTFQCARLMKVFLKTIYPQLVVVHVHSGPDRDILRYDENIDFVQKVLLPRIQEYRDAHAKGLPYPDETLMVQDGGNQDVDEDRQFSPEWRKSFSITLSFADGSPARNYAIQAALRPYRPTYFHFWQLKTFWHDSKIVDSDVEVHSFEEMETLPPIETTQLEVDRPQILQVVEEMKRFRDDMIRILKEENGSNDIRKFWLRKTQKPVLAVLAVKDPSGGLKLYRGTNMEVSMPTGSLCAERNVIGSALADNPGLKRQDLMLIAVLAVPVPKSGIPCGRSTTNTSFVRLHSTNSLCSMQMDEGSSTGGKPPLIPSSRKSSIGEEEDWIFQDPSSAPNIANKTPPLGPMQSATLHVPPDLAFDDVDHSPSASSTPVRRIPLYKSQQQTRTQKRTILVHSDSDINPLRPCGACNEWLKKIAESNPYFTIVTFTDSACNGVYCTPCEE